VSALAAAIAAPDAGSTGDAATQPVRVAAMFETQPGASLRGRPMLKTAIFASLLVALVVGSAMANRGRDAEPVTTMSATAPLELMSMRHARDARALVVSGLVRNPRAGAPLGRVAAVVQAFDRDGGTAGTSTAAIDFTSLAPGAESPFVVTLPTVADVARYRVSFRTDTGALRHVDRRTAAGLRAAAD
jgi:hypothetical protein